MSDHMRKMLDELMGTNRDGVQENSVKYNHPTVCKSYLLGLCPYDLFHNTGSFKSSKKLDLGICSKVHDPALKADYELAAKEKDHDYEIEQLDQVRQFIADCDRKVAVNKRRLEETQDQETLGPEAQAVHMLNEQIGIKLADAEELGAEGKVEESMEKMEEVESLKATKRKAEDIYRNTVPATQNQQQKLRVCEICAAFLSLYDNDRRLADHFGGRLHMGFIRTRDRLKELEEIVAKKREERDKERAKRREERETEKSAEKDDEKDSEKDIEKDRDRGKDHDRERDRDRDRVRDGDRDRDRDRDRVRDRDGDRDRDRDRDRHRDRRDRGSSRRDRDRDRRRSRSRDRERRKRRSRSRSRDKKRSRSRSRDRRRDRSRDKSRDKERSRDKEGEKTKEKDNNNDKDASVNRLTSVEEGEVSDNDKHTDGISEERSEERSEGISEGLSEGKSEGQSELSDQKPEANNTEDIPNPVMDY